MTDYNKLAENNGKILNQNDPKEQIFDWLAQQPLSRDWNKHELIGCIARRLAVLTPEQQEIFLSSWEEEHRIKHVSNDEQGLIISRTAFIMSAIFFAFMVYASIVSGFTDLTIIFCCILAVFLFLIWATFFDTDSTPRKRLKKYLEAHPNAREEFLAANKEILEKEAEEARKKQSESIESTGISKEFLTSNQSLAEEFAAFVRKAAKNSEVVKFLKRIVQYENSTQLTPGTILELFAGLDMLKVSERLGHPFDKDSLASFPFIAVSLGFNDYQLDDWDLSNQSEHTYREMGEIFYNAVMKGVGMNKDAEVDYFGLYIFRSSGYGHEEDYLRFMYRFASLVAKANGNISAEEADILKEIQSQINEICNQKNTTDTQQVQTEDKKEQTAPQQAEPAKPALEQLDELIGLEGVKAEIHKLHNYVKIQRKREACGMQSVPLAVHCVFTGNPGTGKTTVARILAEIFKDLGLLTKGHLVETDRSGLVAEYVGQTAVKTNKIIDSALDGVLFIDEAYTLASGGSNDYGHEAVATLLKRMEDNRDRLIVIIAGYKDEMQKFIDMNPGLQSRFTRYINFEDYNALSLARIFRLNATRYGYTLSPDAERRLNTVLTDMVLHKDEHFGNAREVRNLFEQTLQHQADRLIGIENVSEHDLATIEAEDIVK